jgi:hypothetical protein
VVLYAVGGILYICFHLVTFHSHQINRAGKGPYARPPQYVSRLITKHSVEVTLLYSVRNVCGVYVNKTLARGDSVFYSYWLTGRGSALRAVRAMPLFIPATVDTPEYPAQCDIHD